MGKAVVIVALFALLVYGALVLRERRRTGRRRGSGRPGASPRTQPPRPVAPDDDPDFLRDLERKRRQQEREERDKPDS